MRKLNLFIKSIFVAGILVIANHGSWTAEAAPDARVKGTIRAVTSAGDVTIKPRGDGAEVTLDTNERTEIKRNGSPARVGDLQSGDKAEASYEAATLLAYKIEARGPAGEELARVEGVIAAVDTGASTLTINPGREGASQEAAQVTLNVTTRTAITLDDRPARLSDLERGFAVEALYNRNGFEAARVNARSSARVKGVIRNVDLGARTVTINPRGDGAAVTLHVSAATAIKLDDRPATLEDLVAGYVAEAAYLAGSLEALRIEAYSQAEVTGTIRSVDTGAQTVTIIPTPDGAPLTLDVTSSTMITINGEPATLDRLQPGMPVKATYNRVTLDASKIEARRVTEECTLQRATGKIKNVDTSASTLTLTSETGPDLTLNVTSRTEITIGGQPARLSDLQVGMKAKAKYCRETLNAKEVEVRSPQASR